MDDKQIGQYGGTRRQWLASLWRWCALTGLAVLTGRLLLRPADSSDCGRQVPCRRCALLRRCHLPRAAESRGGETRSSLG